MVLVNLEVLLHLDRVHPAHTHTHTDICGFDGLFVAEHSWVSADGEGETHPLSSVTSVTLWPLKM